MCGQLLNLKKLKIFDIINYKVREKERRNYMCKINMRFKSGKECIFECESYALEKSSLSGELMGFSYKGGVGECPVFFRVGDIESISEFIDKEN